MIAQRLFSPACLFFLLLVSLAPNPLLTKADPLSASSQPIFLTTNNLYSPSADSGISPWKPGGTLSTERYVHTMVGLGNYLYVLGGQNSSTSLSSIEKAAVQKDGALSPWSDGGQLSSPRSGLKAVSVGPYLFVLGGTNEQGEPLDLVERTTQDLDGKVSAWIKVRSLPAPRYNFGAAAANGYIYIAGGVIGTAPTNSVICAQVQPDGQLGEWRELKSLSLARTGLGLIAAENYLFAFGGNNSQFNVNTVEFAMIKPDGAIGEWKNAPAMKEARIYFGAATDDAYLYAIGGANSRNDSIADVEMAPIKKDVSSGEVYLGEWVAQSSLSQDGFGIAAAAFNGYLYVSGGFAREKYSNITEYSKAIGNGPSSSPPIQRTAIGGKDTNKQSDPKSIQTIFFILGLLIVLLLIIYLILREKFKGQRMVFRWPGTKPPNQL